jgi:hypothetical protein
MGYGGDPEADRRVDDARKKLDPEARWAEEQLDQLKKRAAERAAAMLGQAADNEQKMAERAERLADKGKDQGAMPEAALGSLEGASGSAREASRALRGGQTERGQELQREAQRQLESAQEALGTNSDADPNEGDNGDRLSRDHAAIPTADAHKGPEEFRRRVIKGLGEPSSGRLKDAIRRYAEGLLR